MTDLEMANELIAEWKSTAEDNQDIRFYTGELAFTEGAPKVIHRNCADGLNRLLIPKYCVDGGGVCFNYPPDSIMSGDGGMSEHTARFSIGGYLVRVYCVKGFGYMFLPPQAVQEGYDLIYDMEQIGDDFELYRTYRFDLEGNRTLLYTQEWGEKPAKGRRKMKYIVAPELCP